MSDSEARGEFNFSKSIGELVELYGVTKPTLYGYFKHLSIVPIRQGKQSYITQEEWEKVHALIALLRRQKEKGDVPSIAEAIRELRFRSVYIPKTEVELKAEADSEEEEIHPTQPLNSKPLNSKPLMPGFVSSSWAGITDFQLESLIPKFWQFGTGALTPLLDRFSARLIPLPEELAYFRVLSAFANDKYLPSTAELAALLKLKPSTIMSYRDYFEDGGFSFTRAGKRKRGGTAWRVQKLD